MPPKKKSEDLLADLAEDSPAAGEETFDLLDEIGEDDEAESWGSPDNTDAGDGVQGTVISRSTTKSDYTDEPIPVVVIEKADGDKVRVTGYQSVLRKEINDADPQKGDLFAVKYFGVKTTKKDKEYHHYKAVARRGARPAATTTAAKPPF